MSYEKLLVQNKIEPIEPKEFNLELAERDLKVAQDTFNSNNFDWTLTIAYNAVLQASRALMFSLGYRPKGKNQHITVFEFLENSNFDQDLVIYFNGIRKIRHVAVYDDVGTISERTALEALNKAKMFVHKIRTTVHKK